MGFLEFFFVTPSITFLSSSSKSRPVWGLFSALCHASVFLAEHKKKAGKTRSELSTVQEESHPSEYLYRSPLWETHNKICGRNRNSDLSFLQTAVTSHITSQTTVETECGMYSLGWLVEREPHCAHTLHHANLLNVLNLTFSVAIHFSTVWQSLNHLAAQKSNATWRHTLCSWQPHKAK